MVICADCHAEILHALARGWQALADFMLEQRQEAEDYARHEVASSSPPSTGGWKNILGLKGMQGHEGGSAGTGEELEKSVPRGLQCCGIGDGESLALYFVGGSQVAILNFNQAAPKMRIIDIALGTGGGVGGEDIKANSGRTVGKIVGLHVLEAGCEPGK